MDTHGLIKDFTAKMGGALKGYVAYSKANADFCKCFTAREEGTCYGCAKRGDCRTAYMVDVKKRSLFNDMDGLFAWFRNNGGCVIEAMGASEEEASAYDGMMKDYLNGLAEALK